MKIIATITALLTLCTLRAEQYPYRFEGAFEEYKSKPLELIAQYLPDDPCIFEAGGHYGTDTVKFAENWPQGSIYSFEPNPHAYGMLLEATKNFSNIHPQGIAIADQNGTVIFNVCYGSTGDNLIYEGASSILDANDYMAVHYQGPKIEVGCAILDDWTQANGIDHFDFLWMDMEGFELQVLKSSPRILSKVKVIYVETNFQEFRKGMTQYSDLRSFLENNGFQLLSHWYYEGLQGNAIFVKSELIYRRAE